MTNVKRVGLVFGAVAAIFFGSAGRVMAIPCSIFTCTPITISVDELGNSTGLDQATTGTNPLTYTLPFGLDDTNTGWIRLCDPAGCSGNESDLIQFVKPPSCNDNNCQNQQDNNGDNKGQLVFYSFKTLGEAAEAGVLADTYPSWPTITVVASLSFAEGSTGTYIYTPTSSQPGYHNSSHPVTYTLVSDGDISHPPVPEPASLTLLGLGLAGVALRLRRKRQ